MSKITKSEEDWRKELTPEQFASLRQKKTEAPFTGKYLYTDDKGTYACAACGQVIFDSATKFEAHCGWPNFYDAKPGSIELHQDTSFGMLRTEITCANCGGHLGHLFEGEKFDTPTDQRFCINSVSLKFNKNA